MLFSVESARERQKRAACGEYGSTQELDVNVAKAAAAGWRVAQTGRRTTSFLIFATSKAIVCFEKEIRTPADEGATLPFEAPPAPAPSAPREDQ